MSGILFFNTKDLSAIRKFYTSIGATVWLDQGSCIIFRHGNLLLGFCQGKACDTNGIITFFYPDRKGVDTMYNLLTEISTAPKVNEKFRIYHFFAKDPEERVIEFQCFLPYDGIDTLRNRRSIRAYKKEDVEDPILWKIFDVCRFSPTSRNSQSYSFIVIRDKKMLTSLASVRGEPSAPIARAPLAVAVISDPEKSGAYIQDGCIAGYHFMLVAASYGLGTCWIGAMDRLDVKEMLNIPENHYIATITPLGYPETIPEAPPRRTAQEMVTFL
ncbi:MAG: nitroreductase family protein [Theionarchaea archaeon]|nr:nitroreductase family protein [Theionarchaea archaeon]